ncbi:putative transcriptional regulatory protein C3C7.04 like [Verticillium longisporum]|nr:putative transcriptional regulatory protein C3C7.04 like [Verticillium longisporum]
MDDQVPKARVTRAAVHKARRPRAARACDACRTKKNKCDELYPCTYCKNRKLECIYKGQDAASRRYAPDYVRQLEDHVKNLSNRLEELFLQRCERLWTGAEGTRVTSFAAICYSVLALGALVGVRPDEPLEGLTNLQWSRKFFDQAKTYCNQLGMVTDLEMVQCYFFLAKVCQNELSPHLCYMYVGLSVRTALAMGINRGPGPNARTDTARLKAESRTWWGLYSLETELSFAMGRPDTLGADLYHTRPYPFIQGSPNTDASQPELLEPPHCAIIKSMVDFSRLTRTVCLGIYLSDTPVLSTTALAFQIEKDLDRWIESLPEQIRPNISAGPPSTLKAARDPQWAKRQKLALTIQYHNMRILLFGSLLLKSSGTERASIPDAHEATEKYLDSASKTIEIIYRTHEHNDFFRTWFYNTTYTVFAASIILVHITRSSETDNQYLLERVGMAIEILENMDQCVVALEAAKLLRQAKEKAQSSGPFTSSQAAYDFEGTMLLNQYWGPLDLLGGDMDLDFAFQFSDLDAPGAS